MFLNLIFLSTTIIFSNLIHGNPVLHSVQPAPPIDEMNIYLVRYQVSKEPV